MRRSEMERIGTGDLVGLFGKVGEEFAKEKEELCRMDAEMGDGDLGLTMAKGFGALPELLEVNMVEGDIGMTLVKGGMKMASVVPSTMGTLMSSGLMSAGMALRGKASLDGGDLVTFVSAFASGIGRRGKAKAGERTILDAVIASEERGRQALGEDGSLASVIEALYEGSLEGVERTKDMVPVYGKAAVFADKAKGKPDQGAYAFSVMMRGMRNYILG